ncbi:hypothetical protein GE09DRAFT_1231774 [Coniochaeta sp. 2T2.1]|nr:hypothetical protein GE09DRAFT_1231774 [Coniochaeta sp. 2T2.1]
MSHRDDGTNYTRGDRLVPGVPCTQQYRRRYGPPAGQNTPDNPEIFWCYDLQDWDDHEFIDAHHEIVIEKGKEFGDFPTIILRAPSHNTQTIVNPRTGAGLISVGVDTHITASYGEDYDHCQLMVHIYTMEDPDGKMRVRKPHEKVIVQEGYRAASVEVWQIKGKWPDHRMTAFGVEEVPSRALQSNNWRGPQDQPGPSTNSQSQQNNGRGNGEDNDRPRYGSRRNPVGGSGMGNGRNPAGGQGMGFGRAPNRNNGPPPQRNLDVNWRNRENAAPATDDLEGFTVVQGRKNGRK